MKTIRPYILSIISLLFLFQSSAFGQVNVSIQILPPYPTKFTDYASKPQQVLITVTNTSTTTQRIQLRGAVTGDNGVSIRSKMSYKSTSAIELGAGQARNLNGNDIAYFFDYTNLQYTGITQSQFISMGGLPEGSYQFCLRAYNYDTNEPLSAEEPAGCSNTFSISSLEPPTILSPMNEQTVQSGPGQVFAIRWSTPVGTPPGIQYKIRMVEIVGNRNPNDAIMTATQPYFFEKEVMTNMYVYNPADAQLTPGRSYALMVEAFDPFNTVAFRNKGRSEVIMFTYGKNETIPQEVVVVKKDSLAKRTTVITGNLKYRFNEASESGVFALGNTKVYLEKVYVNITNDEVNGTSYKPVNALLAAKIPFLTDPMDGVIAQTDKNGNFEMKVGLTVLDSAGLLSNYHKDLLGINQIKSSSRNMASLNTATIGVMYRLKISNPHFKDYNELLRIVPGDTINLQQKVIDANSYQLRVNVAESFNGSKGKFVPNAKVRIYRVKADKKNKQLDIPLFEGNLLDSVANWKEHGDKVLIAEANTPSPDSLVMNNQTNPKPFTVVFKRLFRNLAQEGYHYLIALEDGERVISQRSFDELVSYKTSQKSMASKSIGSTGKQTWTDFAYNQPLDTAYLTLLKEETASPRSKVTGTLKYAFKYYKGVPNQPYANMAVSLRSSDNLTRVLAATVTDANGKFEFDFDNVDSTRKAQIVLVAGKRQVIQERVYYVVPEVKYYAIPDNKILVQPWSNLDCGELVSLVQTYNLEINAQGDAYKEGSYGKVGLAGNKLPDVPTTYDNMVNAEVLLLRSATDPYKSQIPNLVGMNTAQEVIFEGTNAATNNYKAATSGTANNVGSTVYQGNLVAGEINPRGNRYTLLRTLNAEANASTVTVKGLIPSIDINKDNYQIRVGSNDRGSGITAYETTILDYPYHFIRPKIEVPHLQTELNVGEILQQERDKLYDPTWGYTTHGRDPGGALIKSGLTAKDMVNVNQGVVKAGVGLQVAAPKALGSGKVGLSTNKSWKNLTDPSWKKLSTYLHRQPIFIASTPVDKRKDVYTVGPVINTNALIFNSDLPDQEPAYEEIVKVYTKDWRIAGRVIDGESQLGIARVNIGISYVQTTGPNKGLTFYEPALYTNSNGDFVVTAADLSKPANYYMDKVIKLSIYKDGYEALYKEIGIMAKGRQVYDEQIRLEPSAKDMYGYVVEKGNVARPVVARVKMLNNGVWVNTELNVSTKNVGNRPEVKVVQQFKMNLPNARVKLLIMPYDRAYMTREVEVQVNRNDKFLGTFELTKRVHKMQVNVGIQNSKDLLVPAVVTLVENGMKDTINIGNQGISASFTFVNNATKNYTLHVRPLDNKPVPGKKMFVPTTLVVANEDDGTLKVHTILVSRGKTINGTVTFDDNQPVNTAKVFLETGNGAATENFTRTDQGGKYELVVPVSGADQYNIRASYFEEGQTYISGEKAIDSIGTTANLIIRKVNDIDISRLFGFKTLISTLKDDGGGVYTVSGELYDLPKNKNFGIPQELLNQNISFNAIKIKVSTLRNKNNIPIAVPIDHIITDNKELSIRVNDSFNGIMHGNTDKITIHKSTSDTTGAIMAKVRILDNSFEFPSSYMRMESSDFYLGVQTGAEVMPVFSSAKNPQTVDRFLLTNAQGSPISFRYLGFKGVADTQGDRISNLKGEKISLFLNLSTVLPGNIPLTLKAGVAEVAKGGIGKIINTDTISFSLENWTVRTTASATAGNNSTWELSPSSGGLVLKQGEILTKKLNIPFKNMKIMPAEDGFVGGLDCSDLKSTGAVFTVGGIAKLRTNNGAKSMFIWDPGVGRDGAGHYKVSVTAADYNDYAASFSGLDGMTNPKDAFKIQIISLLSNSEELFSFVNNQSITLYNQIKFTPQTLTTTAQNSLSINGTFNLGIPGLNDRFYEPLVYTKNGLKNKVTMPMFNFSFLGKGGVKFTSSTKKEAQIINAKGFVIAGNMELPGGVKLNGGKLIAMVSKGGQSLLDASGELPRILPPAVGAEVERQIDVLFGGKEAIEKYFTDFKDNLEASIKEAKDQLLKEAEEAVKNEVTKLIPMGTDAAKGALGELAGVWKLGNERFKQGQALAEAIQEGDYMKVAGMMRNIPGINAAIEDIKNKVELQAMNVLTANQDKLPNLKDIPVTGDGFKPGKFEFDLKNGRVFGSISFEAITLGAVGLRKGGMEILFDRQGWYFAAGATMDIPVPLLTPLKVGILLGNYGQIPPDVEARVTQLAQSVSGKLPNSVRNGLSGFFMVGGKPIVDVDLAYGIPPIAEFKLVASAGAEMRVYAMFGKGEFTIGMGGLLYGRLFASAAGLGFSVSGGVDIEVAVGSILKYKDNNFGMCIQGCASARFYLEACAPIAGCGSVDESATFILKLGVGNDAVVKSIGCPKLGVDFSFETGTPSCTKNSNFDF